MKESDMKDVYIFNNETYNLEGVVDEYNSLIWTDRYNECGDFELYVPATERYLLLLQMGYYVWIEDSDHQMVIEDIRITSSVDDGNMMTVKGRSLESFLDRRIIWGHLTFAGNIQNQIRNLMNSSYITPSMPNRRVPNLTFINNEALESSAESYYDDSDLFGNYLYDVILKYCQALQIGFKLVLTKEKTFEFSLYKGVDRSYDQEENPYVIISPAFDNIVSSDYQRDSEDFKNYILVSGTKQPEETEDLEPGQEPPKLEEVLVTTGDEQAVGLNRRETYINATDIQSNEVQNFEAELRRRGDQELSNKKVRNVYDGEIDSNISFQYHKDYFIGDIIQFENGLGTKTRVRISGFTVSVNTSGSSSYPEFDFIDSEDTTL